MLSNKELMLTKPSIMELRSFVQANRELARRESEGHEVVREALAVSVE